MVKVPFKKERSARLIEREKKAKGEEENGKTGEDLAKTARCDGHKKRGEKELDQLPASKGSNQKKTCDAADGFQKGGGHRFRGIRSSSKGKTHGTSRKTKKKRPTEQKRPLSEGRKRPDRI